MEPFELRKELPTGGDRSNTPPRMGLLPTNSFAVPPLGMGPLPADPFYIAGIVNPSLPTQEGEDSDEWEYEYSTIDTETYYVTLDLSHPDLKPKKRPQGPRDLNQEDSVPWSNPGVRPAWKRRTYDPPKKYGATEDKEGDEENLDQEEDEDELPTEISARTTQEVEGQENEKGPSKVQILDLHTKNPLVSYRGHLFSCEWRSNLGTELLFTPHDTQYEEENLTPILRCLPGDVDLIAASSCRIVGKPMILEPKLEAPNPSNVSRQEKAGPSSIPVGYQASQKRKDQGRFLEALQRIKREKGEEDEVTIMITRRRNREMWRAELMRQRQEEREALGEIMGDEEGDEEEREMASNRLREMDREDKERKRRLEGTGIAEDGKINEKKLLKRGRKDLDKRMGSMEGKRKRTPRKMVKEGLEGLITRGDTPNFGNAESLSRFTPSRLMDSVEGEGFDEDMEDEEFHDEGYYYDENAPGEEDDTQMYDA